jgi:sec-independent protein translocase protein TatA
MLLGFGAHPLELLIVLAVALLLFGKRLPDLMRSLGKSITEFKKGVNEIPTDDNLPPKA